MGSFSVLSDDVLVHILSFLDTNERVSTSILAKRWRFLWARAPHLSFVCVGTTASFSSMISRALYLHRGYNIDRFVLSVVDIDGISNSEFETWVAILIDCNVRELDLSIDYVKLPRSLFTCKTLVELELVCCGDIPATSNVDLPALKILKLLGVCFESDESLPHLLSGCPVLEELTITELPEFRFRRSISSPTIKKLKLLHTFEVDEDEDEDMDHQKYFSIGTITSLVEASITCQGEIGDDIPYFGYVVKLVGKLCDVKSLVLSTSLMMEVPDSAFSNLTIKFQNLTKLNVNVDWRFFTKLLESADNLQDLTIRHANECPENWVEPDEVAACLVSHVGIVRFDKFKCTEEQEFKMVRYILRNARVLKRMTIQMICSELDSKNKKQEAVQKIRSFERGSKACEIAFD